MRGPIEALEKLADAGVTFYLAETGSTPIYVSGANTWFGVCPNQHHRINVKYDRNDENGRQMMCMAQLDLGARTKASHFYQITEVLLDDGTKYYISKT
ncbi:hypothetical protein KY328_03350, partial [Candidatus Woesearchaeota archaeon]|nr:hypothetical protein [Candidatus Woesearchaeota archaeon]